MSTDLVTFIARLTDSMLLVATMDNGPEIREYQLHAKRLLKTLKQSSPSRCTFNAGRCSGVCLSVSGVCV